MRLLIIVLAILTISPSFANSALQAFDFPPQKDPRGTTAERPTCQLAELVLPEDVLIYAAGGYKGREIEFQIDQSGHTANQIDVAVNSPTKPVVLILAAYEPTIWNIGWSENTEILGIVVSGYHKQVVAGVDKNMPILISTSENNGPCGSFYISTGIESLKKLNTFSKTIFKKPVDMVFPVRKDGRVVVGQPLLPGTTLLTSCDITPESYFDKSAPKAGTAGLDEALEKGILRYATSEDALKWAQEMAKTIPKQDIPTVAGEDPIKQYTPSFRRSDKTYVVLKPFTYPAGLYGASSATFIIPKGVPMPKGDKGHSQIYDFNTMTCTAYRCNR